MWSHFCLKQERARLEEHDISEEKKKRGWVLSLLLIWNIFSGFAVILYVAVDLLVSPDETLYPFLTPSLVISGILSAIFAMATWNWKKWGVLGLVGTIVISNVLNFNHTALNGTIVIPLIYLVSLGVVLRRKWHLFE